MDKEKGFEGQEMWRLSPDFYTGEAVLCYWLFFDYNKRSIVIDFVFLFNKNYYITVSIWTFTLQGKVILQICHHTNIYGHIFASNSSPKQGMIYVHHDTIQYWKMLLIFFFKCIFSK